MNIKRYELPKTKDPFVNAVLERAGFDTETGLERFWISSCNVKVGHIGVLIDENGGYRTYQFQKKEGYLGSCAYSAVYVGEDILWHLSDTMAVRRVDLKTGAVQDFLTGGNLGLVFAGMQYDEKSGKVLMLANAMQPGLQAVVFNLKTCKTEKIFSDFSDGTLALGGFANGDGTYTVRIGSGGVNASLWRWDPADDSLVKICELPKEAVKHSLHQKISGKWGYYLPGFGWFDGYQVQDGPRPEREARWFGTYENYAYGSDKGIIWRWDMTTGAVIKFCEADGNGAVTRDGCVILFDMYGHFCKFSPDGMLVASKWIEADAYGRTDCMIAADNGMVVGTPFITQRFWILDETTGNGWDAGRAAPGGGEILRVWNLGGKVYMASYTTGSLVEFDPAKPARFPENPCVVANNGKGMRPVADTCDDRCLYYAANHHYGVIGCILTKFDTKTGLASYLDNPMDNQQITSLLRTGDALWAGTTWHSDSRATFETCRDCYLLKLDPDTMEVLMSYIAPAGTDRVEVVGETENGLFVRMHAAETKAQCFCPENGTFTDIEGVPPVYRFMGVAPNEYITLRDGKIERWYIDGKRAVQTATLLEESGLYTYNMNYANGEPVITVCNTTEVFTIRDFMD